MQLDTETRAVVIVVVLRCEVGAPRPGVVLSASPTRLTVLATPRAECGPARAATPPQPNFCFLISNYFVLIIELNIQLSPETPAASGDLIMGTKCPCLHSSDKSPRKGGGEVSTVHTHAAPWLRIVTKLRY